MPFGSADRELLRQVGNQLSQLTADLAAIKQQVADQQHSIDQIRQDATAAITTGLAEIRAVARDGLARTNEIVAGPVASIGNELVSIRSAIGQLDGQLRTMAAPATTQAAPEPEPEPAEDARPEPTPEPPAETELEQPAEEDAAILRAAAGISAATLHAHRGTCEALIVGARPPKPLSAICPCGTRIKFNLNTHIRYCKGCGTDYGHAALIKLAKESRLAA